jgi:hypothetical protein
VVHGEIHDMVVAQPAFAGVVAEARRINARGGRGGITGFEALPLEETPRVVPIQLPDWPRSSGFGSVTVNSFHGRSGRDVRVEEGRAHPAEIL